MEDLLSNPEVAWEWEDYKESMETQADFFTQGDVYKLQSPVVGSRTMPTKNELSALFLERVFRLSRDGVKVSLLLPGTIFGGVMGKDLRTHLLDHTDIENLIGFENKGVLTWLGVGRCYQAVWNWKEKLSGQLNYTDRNHIEKWFQTVTMRIDRFHSFWRGSHSSAKRWLRRFRHYYNRHRPNQALDGCTPVEEALN